MYISKKKNIYIYQYICIYIYQNVYIYISNIYIYISGILSQTLTEFSIGDLARLGFPIPCPATSRTDRRVLHHEDTLYDADFKHNREPQECARSATCRPGMNRSAAWHFEAETLKKRKPQKVRASNSIWRKSHKI